jgi:hypothetical protein
MPVLRVRARVRVRVRNDWVRASPSLRRKVTQTACCITLDPAIQRWPHPYMSASAVPGVPDLCGSANPSDPTPVVFNDGAKHQLPQPRRGRPHDPGRPAGQLRPALSRCANCWLCVATSFASSAISREACLRVHARQWQASADTLLRPSAARAASHICCPVECALVSCVLPPAHHQQQSAAHFNAGNLTVPGSALPYTFSLGSDDGGMLYINDALIADNSGALPPSTRHACQGKSSLRA